MRMSPTIVSIVHGAEDMGMNIVKKTILKNKLFGPNQLNQAK